MREPESSCKKIIVIVLGVNTALCFTLSPVRYLLLAQKDLVCIVLHSHLSLKKKKFQCSDVMRSQIVGDTNPQVISGQEKQTVGE